MNKTAHLVIVSSIMLMIPLSLLFYWIHTMIRDFRLDRSEKAEFDRLMQKQYRKLKGNKG